MTSFNAFGRKAFAALLAASVLGAALAPTAASARDHRPGGHGDHSDRGDRGGRGGHGGHGRFGGHGWGGHGWGGYGWGYAYARDCYLVRRAVVNDFGDVYVRRVRVCD